MNEVKLGIYRIQAIIDGNEHELNKLKTESQRLERRQKDLKNLVEVLRKYEKKENE